MSSPPGTPDPADAQGGAVSEEQALEYIEKHQLSGLFEDLLASVVYHRPKHLLEFLMHVVKERLEAERSGELPGVAGLDLAKLKEVRAKQAPRPLRLGQAAAEVELSGPDTARKAGAVGGIRISASERPMTPRTAQIVAQRAEAIKKQRLEKSGAAAVAELTAAELERLRYEVELEREAESVESHAAQGRGSPRGASSSDEARTRLQSRAKSRQAASRPSTVSAAEHEKRSSTADRDRDLVDVEEEPEGSTVDAARDFGAFQTREDRKTSKKPMTSPRREEGPRAPVQRQPPPPAVYKLPEGFIENAKAEAARAEADKAAKAAAKPAAAAPAAAAASALPASGKGTSAAIAAALEPSGTAMDVDKPDHYVTTRPVSRAELRTASSAAAAASEASSYVPPRSAATAHRKVRPPTFIEAEQQPEAARETASESWKAKMEYLADPDDEESSAAEQPDVLDDDLVEERPLRTPRRSADDEDDVVPGVSRADSSTFGGNAVRGRPPRKLPGSKTMMKRASSTGEVDVETPKKRPQTAKDLDDL